MKPEQLEDILIALMDHTGASDAVLILRHGELKRAEFIHTGNQTPTDLADSLETIAKELREANGQPLGRHGTTMERKAPDDTE